MKKSALVSIASLVIAVALLLCSCLAGYQPIATRTDIGTPSDFASGTDFAGQKAEPALFPGVKAEQLEVSHWLTPRLNNDIMPVELIEYFNRSTLDFAQERGLLFDIKSLGTNYDGAKLRELISSPDLPYKDCYINYAAMPETYTQSLTASLSLQTVPDTVGIKFGVTVNRTDARNFPTDDVCSMSAEHTSDDLFQCGEIYLNEPVAVLNTSTDGTWSYVLCERFGGWIHSSDVAVFTSREEWLDWTGRKNFLVVTGSEISLEPGADADFSGLDICMSTVLPLADEDDGAHKPINRYTVLIPTRDKVGKAGYVQALVARSKDVSVGYPEFTRWNIIEQAFKLIGESYSYRSKQGRDDNPGFVCRVLRCFGITAPRDVKSFWAIPSDTVSFDSMSEANIKRTFRNVMPGSLLVMPAQVMIYLGEEDGRFYAIGAFESSTPAFAATQTRDVMCVSVVALDAKMADGTSWLANLRYAKTLEPQR